MTGEEMLRVRRRTIYGIEVLAKCGCKNPLRCDNCDGASVVPAYATADEVRAWLGLPKRKAKP